MTDRDQPRDGETVLFCSHGNAPHFHFWKMPWGVTFSSTRTGARDVAHWFVCCNDCFVECGGDPTKFSRAVKGVWEGSSPVRWSED